MPMFQICLMILSIVTVLVNSICLLSFKHKTKALWACTLFPLAFAIYASAFYFEDPNIGFILTLVATLIIGMVTTVASTLILGFMKGMPAWVVSGYSTGTGISGITANAIFLTSDSLEVPF